MQSTVAVWDRFIRLFHWSLVVLFAAAFITAEWIDSVHEMAGYAIIALVLARIVWGFTGPEHARFRSFVKSPVETMRFLADTLRLKARRYIGHNPAGGAMVVALLIMLAVITASGILQKTVFWGEKWIETVHTAAAYATLGLIGLHVAGVLLASLEHGENLVSAMLTGKKRAE